MVHYFVDHESSEDELLLINEEEEEPLEDDEIQKSYHFSNFLRLSQDTPKARRITCEPMIDYNQFQIFTFS